MSNGIRQLNASFAPLQDRILFSLGAQDGNEFRFWITRRDLLLLGPLLFRAQRCQPLGVGWVLQVEVVGRFAFKKLLRQCAFARLAWAAQHHAARAVQRGVDRIFGLS